MVEEEEGEVGDVVMVEEVLAVEEVLVMEELQSLLAVEAGVVGLSSATR